MTYSQALRYLESFIDYEKIPSYPYKESLKLERIKEFLETIGNPQNSLRCIHVAGTKGKGSTCALITYILRQAGYRVGLYTSPHLSDFRERIRILEPSRVPGKLKNEFEGMLTKNALANLIEELRPKIDSYNVGSKYGPLSFFEVYTSLAFVYFARNKTDLVVLETGLGGRLDATNVINPLVCVITPISYEHTQKLGNTLSQIAAEKAGIIKTQNGRLPVISAPQEKEAMDVIVERCKTEGAHLYEIGRDIKLVTDNRGFGIKGVRNEYKDLKINLVGSHQLINASVAVAAVEQLLPYGVVTEAGSVRKGLRAALWPGRCEVVAERPLVVLDGAQNVASARALKEAIQVSFRYKKLILVLGISKDKDIKGICAELGDLADEVILTRANSLRAANPRLLAVYFKDKETRITYDVKTALAQARGIAKRQDLILVTGSLFVVGEARLVMH